MNVWERQTGETDKAFAAFSVYIDLPLYGAEVTRSLENTAAIVGHKGASTVEAWSSKYNWVERARAYDAHCNSIELTVKEASLVELQQAQIIYTSEQLIAWRKLAENYLTRMLNAPSLVDAMELQRSITAIEKADNIGRRIAHMPTTYRSEAVADNEQEVYVIGTVEDD